MIVTNWLTDVRRAARGGAITFAARHVLDALATFRGRDGALWPAHASIAARAGCCVRTVQRALSEARRLGLVEWHHRRVRIGWRYVRITNSYRLISPPVPALLDARRAAGERGADTDGHRDRQDQKANKQRQNQETERRRLAAECLDPRVVAAARAALAQAAAASRERLLRTWSTRRAPAAQAREGIA